MKHRERVFKGEIVSQHLVQLFDELDSRADEVSKFLYTGWQRNASLLIVARPSNWLAISERLEQRGCPVAETTASGRLVVLDADTTLAGFMGPHGPDPRLFTETVGAAVERLCAKGSRLYAYGEMVDILASEGRMPAAQALEALWNGLAAEYSFTLLCGYASAHFTDPKAAAALKHICALHTDVSAPPTDLLAQWLLSERRPRFHAES